MRIERRLETKRTQISRHIEVSCLDTGQHYEGSTMDVSDSGLRGKLSTSPKTGADVMVRLFWDPNQNPVETFGRVTWSYPLPGGEGIEVGFMMGAHDEVAQKQRELRKQRRRTTSCRPHRGQSFETKQTLAAIPVLPQVVKDPFDLVVGHTFSTVLAGRTVTARVADLNKVDEAGNLQVTLHFDDKSLWAKPLVPTRKPTTDDVDTSDWNPSAKERLLAWPRQILLQVIPTARWLGRQIHELQLYCWTKIPVSARATMVARWDHLTDRLRKKRAARRRQQRAS